MSFTLRRRTLIGSCLAAPALLGAAHAAEPIRMATWGAGTSRMWRAAFAEPFSKATGIPVTIGEVVAPESQIRNDGDRPQYHVGVVAISEAILLRREGLIADLDGVDLPGVPDTPAAMLPRSDDGKLIGVAPYFQYVGIAVNTDLAPAREFSSWRSLADPKWKGKLAITRPAYSALFDMIMLAIANGGSVADIEPGLKDLAGYAANAMTSYTSMAQMNQLLLRGEIVAGSYYSARIWEMRRQGNRFMELVIPKEGVFPMTYAVVVPKGVTLSPELRQWLAYIATPEPQVRAYDLSGYNPANGKAALDPERTRAELGLTLEELRARMVALDWPLIASEQRARTTIVEQIFARSR
ncbi:MAG: extracellular solute-binding protein [Acetobacteraceae bacterium]|nr:extracellular solute-binding protein [Acetobacteraceae bacterium]